MRVKGSTLTFLLLLCHVSSNFQTVTWYINGLSITNIPSFDAGRGDFDNTNSDPYVTVTTTIGGTTATRYTSSFVTSNVASLTVCSSNSYYSYSSYRYKSPTGCISMGSTKEELLSSSSYKINLYDRNTNSADQLITTFNLTSAAVSCRSYCLLYGYTYKATPLACQCPSVTQNFNISSKIVTLKYSPVMWLYVDASSIFLEIFLPIILGLSFISPILEKIFFSKNSSWMWVPANMLYLIVGGLPTAVLWTVIGCFGRWLFGDSDWGKYQLSFIRYQVAPFGKSLDLHARSRGGCSCNNGGLRMLYTWPITVIWGILMYVHLILQLALTLGLAVTFVFIPFSIVHAKCLAFQFQIRNVTIQGDHASSNNQEKAFPHFAAKTSPPAQNMTSFQSQPSGAASVQLQRPQQSNGPYSTSPVPPSYNARDNPGLPAYLREGEDDQVEDTSAPTVPPPPI
jgi:uncharacterized membrane protein YccF (DUF307 family)